MTPATSGALITDPWRKASPEDGVRWLAAFESRWWIAGGWALDLFAERQTREHKDLDIGVLRGDAPKVLSALGGWEAYEAKDGVLTRLEPVTPPRPSVNSLWCRPVGTREWAMEFMFDDGDEESWIYRRDSSIRSSWRTAIRRSPQGIPYLAPEIQLLFKSQAMRPEDSADFAVTAPRLEPRARAWLKDALSKSNPYHPWLRDLHLSSSH